MGAHDFTTRAFGKDTGAAYDEAVREAQFEYGHDGYNGTISTTSGFVLATLPKGWTTADLMDVAWELEQTGGTTIAKPPIRRAFKADWERREHELAKKRYARWSRLTPAVQREVARVRIEKWGPAIAVEASPAEQRAYRAERPELKGKRGSLFVFFGLAAS